MPSARWTVAGKFFCVALVSSTMAEAQVVFESGRASFNTSMRTFFDGDDCRGDESDSLELIPGGPAFTPDVACSCESGGYTADNAFSANQQLVNIPDGFGGTGTMMASASHGFPPELPQPGTLSVRTGGGFNALFTTESTATVTVTGTLTATANAPFAGTFDSAFRLIDVNANEDIANIRASGPPLEGEFESMVTLDETIILDPGRYQIIFNGNGIPALDSRFGPQDGQSSYDIEFSVVGEGGNGEFDTVFWEAADGNYDDETNWEPEQVPGDAQTAIFDRDGFYTVSVDGESTGRAIFERGDVTLEGSDFSLVNTDDETPSLIVGRDVNEPATVSLEVSDIDTVFAAIGYNADRDGTVQVSEGTFWNNAATLWVGDLGTGRLMTLDDARVTTAELLVGDSAGAVGIVEVLGEGLLDAKQDFPTQLISGSTAIGASGEGTLRISDVGAMETGETQIGVFPGSVGMVVMSENEMGSLWTLGGDLIIGNEGEGTLDMRPAFAGSQIFAAEGSTPTLVIGNGEGGVGTVLMSGAGTTIETPGSVFVGPTGDGLLMIQGFGQVSAAEMFVGPFEAESPDTAGGELVIVGSGETDTDEMQVLLSGDLHIGERGPGTLAISNEGAVVARDVLIANGDGGGADVQIDSALLESTRDIFAGQTNAAGEPIGSALIRMVDGDIICEDFFLDPGSRIEGDGVIRANLALIQGDMAPGVALGQSGSSKGETTTLGTLMFDGGLSQAGGMLEIEVSGANAFDVVEVSGDAELSDTTVMLTLLDGYQPATGQDFGFLTAGGTLTTENLTVLVDGAGAGFAFDLVTAGGSLMVMTVSGMEPEGEGEGEGESMMGCGAGAGHYGHAPGDLAVLLVILILCRLIRRAPSPH